MVQFVGNETKVWLSLLELVDKIKGLLPMTLSEHDELDSQLTLMQNEFILTPPEMYFLNLKRLVYFLANNTAKHRDTSWVKEIQTLLLKERN